MKCDTCDYQHEYYVEGSCAGKYCCIGKSPQDCDEWEAKNDFLPSERPKNGQSQDKL